MTTTRLWLAHAVVVEICPQSFADPTGGGTVRVEGHGHGLLEVGGV